MTLEAEVANLTAQGAALLSTINGQKDVLIQRVADATAQADRAAAQAGQVNNGVGAAAGSAAQALAIYGTTNAMNAALVTAAAQSAAAQAAATSAASVLSQDLSAVSAALHRSPNPITAMCIYRTELDSDGGAWVDRMQHTSWMNEPLNGAWRGALASEAAARAISGAATGDYYQLTTDGKFYKLNAGAGVTEVFRGNKAKCSRLPLAVAAAGNVSLYDPTEPGRPMWGRWDFAAGTFGTITSVAALNGKVLVGTTLGLITLDFAKDEGRFQQAAADRSFRLIDRASGSQVLLARPAQAFIVNNTVNAVAMTVLPDAVFDVATGLQTPTISVFTAGGISVIQDTGTVANSAATTAFTAGRIDDNEIVGINSTGALVSTLKPRALTAGFAMTSYLTTTSPALMGVPTVMSGSKAMKGFGNTSGVTLLKENISTPAKGISARITGTFNTGHLLSDIRRAYLCNTEAESVSNPATIADRSYKAASATVYGTLVKTPVAVGAQLVAWSGFSATNYIQEPPSTDLDFGTNEWQFGDWFSAPAVLPASSFPVVSAQLATNGDLSSGTTGWVNRSTGTGTFSVTAGVAKISGSDTANRGAFEQSVAVTSGKWYLFTWTPVAETVSGATIGVWPQANAAGTVYAATFGAAGSLLVNVTAATAFIRFTTNSTGGSADISNISYREIGITVIADRSAATGPSIKLGMDFAGKLVATAFDGTTTRTVVTDAAYNTGVYMLAEACYKAGKLWIEVSGTEVKSVTGAPLLTMNNALAVLTIGQSRTLDAPWPGSLAPLKIGGTVPTVEQSVWKHSQEKQMFMPGAQITLPTAQAVTDLSYDESQDRWCVTQAGNESSFTGLIRTSTAVVSAGSFTKVDAKGGVKLLARSTTSPGVDVTVPAYGLREELVRRAEAAAKLAKLPEPHNFDAIAAQTDFPLPAGWTAIEVLSAGNSQREGATKAWVRKFDGFRETVSFAVAPGAATWVQIIARKE